MINRMIRRLQRSAAKSTTPTEIEYRCGNINLALPVGHGLPLYQRRHPHYDRFLPHIAKYIPNGSTVIDVGANCGDTVVAMAQINPTLNYLCVEPDHTFLAYFHRNLARLRELTPSINVDAVQAIVGKAIYAASLSGDRGTKHAELDEHGQRTTLLDDIYKMASRPPVSLLKSDVDGYDFDVIDSGASLIQAQQPALFFECQYFNLAQLQGFQATIERLVFEGYSHWTVFDNFGEVVIRDASQSTINQLLEYVWQQNQGRSTRTIYYFDLLACTPQHKGWVAQSVEEY